MKQNVKISFLDPIIGTSYTLSEPVAYDVAHEMVKKINSTKFDNNSCLHFNASFITHNHMWIIGKFGNGTSPCNKIAQCRIEHILPHDKLRACIGRMSRGQCDCNAARPSICATIWPDTYCKQR